MANTIFAGLPDPSTYQGYDLTKPDPSHLKPLISQWLRQNHGGVTAALTGKSLTPDMVGGFNKELGLDPNSQDALKFIDGESLGFSGDEFVHGAPVGHGLQRGTYDPSADNEVFWGSQTPQAPSSSSPMAPSAASRPSSPFAQFFADESHLAGGGNLPPDTLPASPSSDPNTVLAPFDAQLRDELLRQLSGKGVD